MRAIALAAVLTIAMAAAPAHAADVHQVGNTYFERGHQNQYSDDLFFVVMDGPTKVAGLIADVAHMDPKAPHDRLFLTFTEDSDWRKFVGLWDKARHTKADETQDIEVGSYFDPIEHTLITVHVEKDGVIEFFLAGQPGANNQPKVITLFEMGPADLASFDHDVEAVTAYFQK